MLVVKQNTIASNVNDINKIDRMIVINIKTTIVVSKGLFNKPFISLTT